MELKSPLFLNASLIILNHSLFVSLFLSKTRHSLFLSLNALSMTLYFSLFGNRTLRLSLISFGPNQSPPPSISFSHYCPLLHPIHFLSVSLSLPSSHFGCFILHLPLSISISTLCAVHLISFDISVCLSYLDSIPLVT